MHCCFLARRHLVAYSRVLRFRLFVDLASTEGLDSLKVDKGRLGQLTHQASSGFLRLPSVQRAVMLPSLRESTWPAQREGLDGSPHAKPQVDRFFFPVVHCVVVLTSGRLLDFEFATGHPSLLMLCSFTNQVLAQIGLLTYWKETAGYRYVVHLFFRSCSMRECRALCPHSGFACGSIVPAKIHWQRSRRDP